MVFDFSFPKAKKIPLAKFLSLAEDITVVKLKISIDQLQEKLSQFVKER